VGGRARKPYLFYLSGGRKGQFRNGGEGRKSRWEGKKREGGGRSDNSKKVFYLMRQTKNREKDLFSCNRATSLCERRERESQRLRGKVANGKRGDTSIGESGTGERFGEPAGPRSERGKRTGERDR